MHIINTRTNARFWETKINMRLLPWRNPIQTTKEYCLQLKNTLYVSKIKTMNGFCLLFSLQFSSVQSLCHVRLFGPHGLQQARPPCPSPTSGVYWNSCPLSRWCHPAISSSVVPFSSYLQSLPASGSFQMSLLFTSGGQRTGVSASTSVLPINIQDWSPLGWIGWISLQSKGLSRVFFNTRVQKHQFFHPQLSL